MVLDSITDNDLWDASTIVLWSDHGYHLGDRDVVRKVTLWEEAANVPFVIVDPDVGRAGETISTPVSLLDVWPTLSGLTGMAAPATSDVVDLSGLLLGGVGSIDHEGVITSAIGALSVRTETWRYSLYPSGEEELLRIDADGEIYRVDLSHRAGKADTLAELRELLIWEAEGTASLSPTSGAQPGAPPRARSSRTSTGPGSRAGAATTSTSSRPLPKLSSRAVAGTTRSMCRPTTGSSCSTTSRTPR